jgi:hypothetical protein
VPRDQRRKSLFGAAEGILLQQLHVRHHLHLPINVRPNAKPTGNS